MVKIKKLLGIFVLIIFLIRTFPIICFCDTTTTTDTTITETATAILSSTVTTYVTTATLNTTSTFNNFTTCTTLYTSTSIINVVGTGGFPWWVIFIGVVVVALYIVVFRRRNR
jgi:uncharacterized membrane protein